jgi:hypothetical protein
MICGLFYRFELQGKNQLCLHSVFDSSYITPWDLFYPYHVCNMYLKFYTIKGVEVHLHPYT